MHRKFILLGFCALIGLAAILVFGRKRPLAANQDVVITPDGKLMVAPRRDAWTVTMEQPQAKTNSSRAITNSSSISTK